MFKFNSNTCVNKEFKIREILTLIGAKKEIRSEATIINNITLTDVISEETLNIKSNELCKEIYILKLDLKEKQVPLEFIKAFDKFIQLHTYFVLHYENEIKELCIYRYIENDEIKRGKAYEGPWHIKKFKALPYVINIGEIYRNLIFQLIELKPNDNESLNDYLNRYIRIQKLKKEIETLQKKAFRETQSKKKFEISKELRNKKDILRGYEGDNNGQT